MKSVKPEPDAGSAKVSIITPVHAAVSPYLDQCYESLDKQTEHDWQWVIILNNHGVVSDLIRADNRVKVIDVGESFAGQVGYLKKLACNAADAPLIVELDGDDMLTPDALARVCDAFSENPKAMFVYSNNAQFDKDWNTVKYGEYWGWRHRDYTHVDEEGDEHVLTSNICWPPTVHSIRRVEFAPDHVRAWRKQAYDLIGGHDERIRLGDDHELICRFYMAFGQQGFHHIDDVLYLYRKHDNNTSVMDNAGVQAQVAVNYDTYIQPMSIRWAQDNGLPCYDLGGRINAVPGFKTVDLLDADIIADLQQTWPFADNSVGVLRAYHLLEHLVDPIHAMNEAYRVLAPGGIMLIEVPSTDGRGAFCDPTHISFWNQRSFAYYTDASTARFIRPMYKGRFQALRVETLYPSPWWQEQGMPVVRAELVALKDGYDRPAGEVLI